MTMMNMLTVYGKTFDNIVTIIDENTGKNKAFACWVGFSLLDIVGK